MPISSVGLWPHTNNQLKKAINKLLWNLDTLFPAESQCVGNAAMSDAA